MPAINKRCSFRKENDLKALHHDLMHAKVILEEERTLKVSWAEKKLKQANEIYIELLKLKKGRSKFQCPVRNLLHIFGGEMEINSIEVKEETKTIVSILDEGISSLNWYKIDDVMTSMYGKILKYSGKTELLE